MWLVTQHSAVRLNGTTQHDQKRHWPWIDLRTTRARVLGRVADTRVGSIIELGIGL